MVVKMGRPTRSQLIKFVQSELNRLYNRNLRVDGMMGRNTADALNLVSAVPSTWPLARRIVGFLQYLTVVESQLDDIVIDGFWGPNTEYAYESLVELRTKGSVSNWRDEQTTEPKYSWPRYRDIKSVFGEPGTRQSKVTSPYKLKLAWDLDTTITRFTCHELAVEPFREAMEEILSVYGKDGIEELKLDYWGGCFNYRRMRSGSKLSTHAFGISCDWIPQENSLRWDSSRASLARPEYNDFWKAWENVGATSLGRKRNFDWMHVQLSDL